MKTQVIKAGVRKDRVPVGFNEDGDIFGDEFAVVAESPTGRRWVHREAFAKVEVAGRVARRVEAAGVINLEHWVETYPVYGSAAWEVEDGERAANLRFALQAGDAEAIERFS